MATVITNRFNLIDEPWIPVVNEGLVSLRQVFSEKRYRALGGNPIQKISLTKLLLAIAHGASTPKDDAQWVEMGVNGMAEKCLSYLDEWHDSFWLYGEKPFLQMPEIAKAKVKNFGAVLPEISTGNTTVLSHIQIERELNDAEKALLIVSLMGFALGGKKTDNSIVLTAGYTGKSNDKGKPGSGKFGPSIGFMGYLHSFLVGSSLTETIWFNLLPEKKLKEISIYSEGIGRPVWEDMPEGEDCVIAKKIRNSFQGRLLPMSRFCLLCDGGMHYSEGIAHPDHNEGGVDHSIGVNFNLKKPKVIWADPGKRPWRHLTSLLSFISSQDSSGFDCVLLRNALPNARTTSEKFGIWSGGIRVSSNAGEQFASGSDDFVESTIFLQSNFIGEPWFEKLKQEMSDLDALSKKVYGTTLNYFKDQSAEGKNQAVQASNLFWQLCGNDFQDLVDACGDIAQAKKIRRVFARHADKAYNTFCSKESARQLDAWAKNKPNLASYLQ